MRRVTLKDLARQAGVSHTAVSMALRGSEAVGPELATRLRRLAAEAGYSPRLAAQHLRVGRTGQVGIVMAIRDARTAFGAPSLSSLLGAVVWECDRAGRRYVLEFTQSGSGDPFVPPSQVTGQTVDGTILTGDTGDSLRDWLAARGGYPWISIEEPAPYCVAGRMDAGIGEAVDRLVAAGHRRIAYAGGPQVYQTHRLGLRGFEEARQRHSLPLPDDWVRLFDGRPGDGRVTESYEWASVLLRRPARPTAFVCHGVALARNAIFAACEAGLAVPDALSVVSCGPTQIAHLYHPRLTTIELDCASMTREAMELWGALVDGLPAGPPQRWVAPRLVEGETVGPAPAVRGTRRSKRLPRGH